MKIKNTLQVMLARFKESNNFYDELFDEINPDSSASTYADLDERHRANRAISNFTAAWFILLRIVALPAFAGLIFLFVVTGLVKGFTGPTLAVCLLFCTLATSWFSYFSLNICFLSGELRNKYARQIKNNESFSPKTLNFDVICRAFKDKKIYDSKKARNVLLNDLLWSFYVPTFAFAAVFLTYIEMLSFSLSGFTGVVAFAAVCVLTFSNYIRRRQNTAYLTICRYL
ncbi:hypothetical protein I5S53_04590 [Pseudomonas juntendi]|uniref:Uncharacterized protein n=1 Tax=Pseudomonas helleri TaxID=1608996 RepID=A0A7X1WC33_9PSED|nr:MULTISPECIES: hypothetical protein [Pseudomonas]MBH3383255.1 hypothetical protein [Pseudomonas juntendi]MQT48996.1 hypothetical protein [Pseudomonas helleri]